MAAGATYTPIATTTLGSATNSITFSSIPSTYTDLVLVFNGSMASAADLLMQFNSDTATNYSDTILQGNGTSATSSRDTSQTSMTLGITGTGKTNIFTSIANIQNYSNTTTYKTVLVRVSEASTLTGAVVNLWRKTPEAINTIKVYGNGSVNISAGSIATLYGIKAA